MQLPVLRRGERPAPLSYRTRVLYAGAWVGGRTVGRVPPLHPRSLVIAERLDTLAGRRRRMPRGTSVTPVQLDGFDAEWVRAEQASDDGVVLYFHGGGFIACGLNTHRPGIAAISKRSGLPAFSVAYRQLPRTPITGSVDDCLTAYRYLLDLGHKPEQIVFAGDSAGGYLTFATALKARDEGLPLPAGLVALSPLLDIDSTTRRQHANWRRDTYILAKHLPKLSEFWSTSPDGTAPISPVNEDLTGMPPSLIMAAETEVLLSDSEVMAERLWAAGAQCKLQVWRGQVHAFPMIAPTPEVRIAHQQIGKFIRETVKSA
jgi:acetyl esterase/lipase